MIMNDLLNSLESELVALAKQKEKGGAEREESQREGEERGAAEKVQVQLQLQTAEQDRQALQVEREATNTLRQRLLQTTMAETRLLERVTQLEAEVADSARREKEVEERHLHEWSFLEADMTAKMEEGERAVQELRGQLQAERKEVERARAAPRHEHKAELDDMRRSCEAKIKEVQNKYLGLQQILQQQQAEYKTLQQKYRELQLRQHQSSSPRRDKTPDSSQQLSSTFKRKKLEVSFIQKKPEVSFIKVPARRATKSPTPAGDTSVFSSSKKKRVSFDLREDKESSSLTGTLHTGGGSSSTKQSQQDGGRISLGALLSVPPPLPPTLFGATARRAPTSARKKKLFSEDTSAPKDFD